jgi:hypothetical protein
LKLVAMARQPFVLGLETFMRRSPLADLGGHRRVSRLDLNMSLLEPRIVRLEALMS